MIRGLAKVFPVACDLDVCCFGFHLLVTMGRLTSFGLRPTAFLILICVYACLNWNILRKLAVNVNDPGLVFANDGSPRRQPVRKLHHPIHAPKTTLELPTYTKRQAKQAIRPASWICGDKHDKSLDTLTNLKPFFGFVHVYKTAGSTLREFFTEYAMHCRKSFMLLVNCSGLKHPVISSRGEVKEWNNCRLKYVLDGRNGISEHDGMELEERAYPSVNNSVLLDKIDILGGHFRIGSADYAFQDIQQLQSKRQSAQSTTPVRHIVFLRQPMERYVSGMLYRAKNYQKNKKESLVGTVSYIKKRVLESRRKKNEYATGVLNYLLTPEQQGKMKAKDMGTVHIEASDVSLEEQLVSYNTRVAIDNLAKYNVIMGMTERFTESMLILRHVLGTTPFTSDERRDAMKEMFDEYTNTTTGDSNKNAVKNPSTMGVISTSSVMTELEDDADFMTEFKEYVKYEQMVVDFAWKMHVMQYELATTAKADSS